MPAEAKADIANWRTRPHSAWAFHHVEDLIACAAVANDPAEVSMLDARGGRVGFLGGTLLKATATDAIVVLVGGKLVFERYANGNTAATPHILMSATKAVVGLLAGMLAADGVLDPQAPASAHVPEVAATPYAGATLRHLLDMRTGVVLDRRQQRAYEAASNWGPVAAEDPPAGLRDFFATLDGPAAPHGGPFSYVSANYDLLGLVLERATGQTVASLLSSRLWRPMGAERSAAITVDREGLARCTGGLCATARDFARIGQLMIEGGRRGSRQVIAGSVITDVVENGDAAAWRDGAWSRQFAAIGRNMRYRNGWYVVEDEPRLLFAMGIHGQNLFVDIDNNVVVAKFSSLAKPIMGLPIWLTHRGMRRLQRSVRGRRVPARTEPRAPAA